MSSLFACLLAAVFSLHLHKHGTVEIVHGSGKKEQKNLNDNENVSQNVRKGERKGGINFQLQMNILVYSQTTSRINLAAITGSIM